MKRYLYKASLLLLAIFAAAASYGQLTIDQIDSDSAALRYVRQMNYDAKAAPQWKFFYLTTGNEWASYFNFSESEIAKYQQKMPTKSWLKTDINGDGKTDLLVSGYIARKPGDWGTATFKILAFLSQPGKRYAELNILTKESEKYPAYIEPALAAGKSALALYRWQVHQGKKGDQPYISDLLGYNTYWDSFVDITDKPMRNAEIQYVSYKMMENVDGSYHAVNIDLLTTKKNNMEVVVNSASAKEPETHKARLTKDLWSHMDTLLRNSYVTGQVNGDTTVVRHDFNSTQLPIYLTIVYKDGHKQTIQDYDNGANYSIITIYSCMENIIQNVFEQLQNRQMLLNSMIGGSY